METRANKKHSLLELEALSTDLIEKVCSTSSTNLKVFLYYNYFDQVLASNNPNFIEAFLKEFIDDYVSTITRFEAFGSNPDISEKILSQLKSITSLSIFSNNISVLNPEIERIELQIKKLNLILYGKEYEDYVRNKGFFPLIDKEAPDDFYGIIESVTIRINKAANSDKFIIVPSEKEIEKRISEQCKKSWLLAVDILKKYIKKPYQYHEVIISFDKKVGFYEGNSLGIALTLSFLAELLKFYNPSYVIKIKEHSAFTGGVDEKGNVLETGEDIIKQKVKAIFYSEINSFVFPKTEETYAYFALAQLKKNYPERNLKLIPVEDFNDVINRRDLVDIKKQKIVVRTGKFVKKNWVSAAAAVLLAILFAFLFVIDFDDNPSLLTYKTDTIFVKNKNGKVLWNINVNLDLRDMMNADLLKKYARILDIDNDFVNEIIVTQFIGQDEIISKKIGTIICYDKYKEIKWEYNFQDTVYSEREDLKPDYNVRFIDTTTFHNKKVLLCFANNASSFSSAIFGLELSSGIRIKQTQWNSGYTIDAIILDLNNDKEKEFVGVGIDNGFNCGVLWGVRLDDLYGFRPTAENYIIQNFEETELLFYIRLPNTDLDEHNGVRTGLLEGSLTYNKKDKDIKFVTTSVIDTLTGQTTPSIFYYLSENLVDFDIYLFDKFTANRDSLVVKGKLNPPYADTKEYKKILMNRILYYKIGEWLKYELLK